MENSSRRLIQETYVTEQKELDDWLHERGVTQGRVQTAPKFLVQAIGIQRCHLLRWGLWKMERLSNRGLI